MRTVGKTAILGESEDLLEIAGKLFGFHIEGTETLDTWCIDEPPTTQGDHLREGGGVLSGIMGIRDFGCALGGTWHQTIDKGGLAYTTVATEQGNLSTQQVA